ncbi:protein kinase [Paramagnetospirillum kuznetsovii]|uniref:Protein kinase n=1 Tax=Paramagnetospirillum kuznetsovii TaxID=2053833 RepID=A0A364NX69_9PROT|nr:cyclic nucleotide-binding domain-containing protein [Paramagnetospirillum kuznetsovii]RAU21507.1 protein kinase [Paramagnetospirillum kuznetsovii]
MDTSKSNRAASGAAYSVHGLKAEDLAAIGRLPLFCDLPPAILADMTAEASVTKYQRNEIIFHQGDIPTALRVVLDGQVGLTGTVTDGGETMVEILKAGEMFIAAAVLTEKPFLMSAVALQTARILSLPGDRFRRDVRESPDIAFLMLASMAKHFSMLVREVKDLKLKSAAQRLALYLLGLTAKREGSTIVRLPHSKSVIAARVGVRPETLSRAFAHLRERGVAVDGHAVAIADIPALRVYCHEGEEII